MPVKRRVRIRRAFTLDFWMRSKKLVVEHLFIGGDIAFFLCGHGTFLPPIRTGALISPAKEYATCCVAGTYSHDEHQVTLAETTLLDGIPQSQGNRTRRCVRVAVDIHKHF